MTNNYWLRLAGKTAGPFSSEKVLEMYRNGDITTEALSTAATTDQPPAVTKFASGWNPVRCLVPAILAEPAPTPKPAPTPNASGPAASGRSDHQLPPRQQEPAKPVTPQTIKLVPLSLHAVKPVPTEAAQPGDTARHVQAKREAETNCTSDPAYWEKLAAELRRKADATKQQALEAAHAMADGALHTALLCAHSEQDRRPEPLLPFQPKERRFTGHDKCNYCGTSFQTTRSGFYFGSAIHDIGDSILRMRKICNECGVPVCFNCAADAAEKRGMKNHCICPKCGANL